MNLLSPSLAVLTLILLGGAARADRYPDFEDDAKPILRMQPHLIDYVRHTFQVRDMGIARIPGTDDRPPQPPFIFKARPRGTSGAYFITLLIQPGPPGRILKVVDPTQPRGRMPGMAGPAGPGQMPPQEGPGGQQPMPPQEQTPPQEPFQPSGPSPAAQNPPDENQSQAPPAPSTPSAPTSDTPSGPTADTPSGPINSDGASAPLPPAPANSPGLAPPPDPAPAQ